MQMTASRKYGILFLLLIVRFLTGAGIDLYVPSLPAISGYFSVSDHMTQLTIGLYMLGYAVGQMFLGVLSDGIGRRRIILNSAFVFTIVSFLSVFARTIELLIFYRLLQGICIAGMTVVGRAIATDCFEGLELNKAMIYLSTSWALGPIIGPFIGGYLQHYFNWQADFYFFGIYGLFIFAYAIFAVPETNRYKQSLRPMAMLKMVATVVRHPIFICATVIPSLSYAALVVFNVVGPFIIQIGLHYSPVAYGHMALLLGVAYFSGTICNRYMIGSLQPMKIVFIGLLGVLITSVIFVVASMLIAVNIYLVLVPVFFVMFFVGFILPNMAAKCVRLFPKMAGSASAIYGSLVAGGVFLVTMFATTLHTNSPRPLAITYLVMAIITMSMFIVCNLIERIKN
ncbi:MAG: multidrug effflux MFS transporter [Gammaproteobacteria bacterium]|nr:multidrug effflux MFS transporter [Gammaproteobacteria bacterium]